MDYLGDGTKAAIIGGASGVVVGGTLGYIAGKRTSKKSNKKRKSRNKNKKKSVSSTKKKGKKLKFGSPAYRKKYLNKKKRKIKRNVKQKKPYTAGKRKDTSKRRVRFTKNNVPYIIQSDGKARFISKKQLKAYRKRKGGKY